MAITRFPIMENMATVIPERNDDDTGSATLCISDMAARLRSNIGVQDRTYHLKTYEKCFIGSEAVQYLVQSGLAGNEEEAIVLGNVMMEHGLFTHVTRDHNFKNELLFYRFHQDSRSHGESAKDSSGKNISIWRRFAGHYLGDSGGQSERMSFVSDMPARDGGLDTSDLGFMDDIPPIDEWNIKLLDNVHPSTWQPPDPVSHYNLLVIGGGAAGLVSSLGAAGVGGQVCLVESHFMGGDCTNFGCVPSKALIKSSLVAKTCRNSGLYGVDISGPISVNFGKVMERMRRIRADISGFDAAERLARLGIDVYIGRAVFDSPTSVVVNERRILFRKCIICSGASSYVPDLPGLATVPYMTNETLFNLTSLPPRMVVLGGGPIGAEMAQAFANFGCRVTVITRSDRIMKKEDADASAVVEKSMEEDGVRFVHHAKIEGMSPVDVTTSEIRISVNGVEEVIQTEAILVATGRRPRVRGLGLEAAGVKFNDVDGISVNDNMRTTNTNIFAAGDCCSRYQFTHMADWMARICIKNALFFGGDKFSALIIPWCTYTDPELAHVGLYSHDLESKNISFDTFVKEFSDNDRAKCEGQIVGFVKIHVKKGTDVILGATIVGEGAGDMISEVTIAMHAGMGLGKLSSVIHPYPTRADAIRNIGDQFNKTALTVSVRRLLRAIIAISSG